MSDAINTEKQEAIAPGKEELDRERRELLRRLEDWLETPMLVLAIAWLVLLIVELTWGESRLFDIIGTAIWGVFILNFTVEFILAPDKVAYLKSNWLTAVSLLIPALRIFRMFRLLQFARAGRGLRLLRIVSSLNRGMLALGASLRRRGFGYVLALTVLVTFAGAAGMFAFESDSPGGLDSYVEALWWTAMVMTTMGSQYWPQSKAARCASFWRSMHSPSLATSRRR